MDQDFVTQNATNAARTGVIVIAQPLFGQSQELRFQHVKEKGRQNIKSIALLFLHLIRSKSKQHRHVEYSFYFIAAGLPPMPEAVRFIGWSFEKLCYFESGGHIQSKDLEAGIC